MLVETIRAAARRFGDATMMESPEGSLSFAELDARSDRLAAALWHNGIRIGDRVALRLPSGTSYVLAYAAAAKLGAAVAGINTGLAEAEQQRLVTLADPALVIGNVETVLDFEECGDPSRIPDVAPDPTRLVALVFTSGTTGTPRAAMYTEVQLAAVMRIETGGSWAQRPGVSSLVSTHLAHVGPMTKLPWYLRNGLRLHVLPRWRAGDVLQAVAKLRLAEIGAIPAQIALMLRAPEFTDVDLSCVRRIIAGGAASPPVLIETARRAFGADYVIRYSSTESGGVGLGTSAEDPDEALRSVGHPRRGVRAEVRDTDGTLLPRGEVGELCLRTPTAMTGYWRDDEATAATLVDGWLRTGDLAEQNADGTFTLKGRLKEMYIRGGYNVYPAEVEAQLSSHPAVAGCAIVPRLDPTMGEVGVAVVTLRKHCRTLNLADVRSFLEGRIAPWKQPEDLRVVDDLPLNGTHKVDRLALTAMVAHPAASVQP
jgi:acyl-CoA synthetase (AMP-forming)/AMP-acid ligase II